MAKLELVLEGHRAAILLPAEDWTGQLRLQIVRGRLIPAGTETPAPARLCSRCGTETIRITRVEGLRAERR